MDCITKVSSNVIRLLLAIQCSMWEHDMLSLTIVYTQYSALWEYDMPSQTISAHHVHQLDHDKKTLIRWSFVKSKYVERRGK